MSFTGGVTTRLGITPTDRCFIQILRHILLAAYAESRCTIAAVPFCLETAFLHSLLLGDVPNIFVIFIILPLR